MSAAVGYLNYHVDYSMGMVDVLDTSSGRRFSKGS